MPFYRRNLCDDIEKNCENSVLKLQTVCFGGCGQFELIETQFISKKINSSFLIALNTLQSNWKLQMNSYFPRKFAISI